MQDNPKIGTLQRFSRDITVLAGRGSKSGDPGGFAGFGVLDRFSGHLDVRLGPGRAPTIDLSYLTLASLVAAGGETSGRADPTRGAGDGLLEPGPPPTESRTRTGDRDGAPVDRAGAEEPVEPTVREVLHRSRDATATGDRPSGTRDGPEGAADRSGDAPPDGDRARAGERAHGPERSLLDPGPGLERSNSDRDVGEQYSSGSSGDFGRTPPSRDTRGLDRATRTGRADRSVSDRDDRGVNGPAGPDATNDPAATEPTMRALDRSVGDGPGRSRDPSAPDPGTGVSISGGGVPPPRMSPDTGDRSTATAAERSTGTATRQPSDTGRVSANRSTPGATAGRDPGSRRPRLVLHPRDRGPMTDDEDQGDTEHPRSRRSDSEGSKGAADRAAISADPLSDLVPASPDPENPAIDRLYRALQEREAIERRRGGEP